MGGLSQHHMHRRRVGAWGAFSCTPQSCPARLMHMRVGCGHAACAADEYHANGMPPCAARCGGGGSWRRRWRRSAYSKNSSGSLRMSNGMTSISQVVRDVDVTRLRLARLEDGCCDDQLGIELPPMCTHAMLLAPGSPSRCLELLAVSRSAFSPCLEDDVNESSHVLLKCLRTRQTAHAQRESAVTHLPVESAARRTCCALAASATWGRGTLTNQEIRRSTVRCASCPECP